MNAVRITPTRETITAALAVHRRRTFPPMPGRTNHLDAGILVPIVWGDEPSCVLTERSPTLRHHAGEICFPGGRPEAQDESLMATALREAQEEIGIENVQVIGELSSVPLMTSDHRIHPFVGIAESAVLVPNPAEVRRMVHYSLPELLGRESIDAITWTRDGESDLAPVFETGGRLLFGATAYVLYELLVAVAPAFGATAPTRIAGKYTWQDVL